MSGTVTRQLHAAKGTVASSRQSCFGLTPCLAMVPVHAGRAGRVRPGHCFRLCTEADFAELRDTGVSSSLHQHIQGKFVGTTFPCNGSAAPLVQDTFLQAALATFVHNRD